MCDRTYIKILTENNTDNNRKSRNINNMYNIRKHFQCIEKKFVFKGIERN